MKMLKISFLTILIIFLFYSQLISQNGLIGAGFGANNWLNIDNFVGSAGTSRIGIFTPNGTGDQYFRLVTNWEGNNDQWGPSSTTEDYSITVETEIPSSQIIQNSITKAYYTNVTSTGHNYVFKTKAGGNPPSSIGLIVFKVEGDIRSVSSVSKDKSIVYRGQPVTITATLNGSLNSGQGVYLRYSIDNFANSTIVEMTGSNDTYSITIPSNINAAGNTINYYVFTSGDGLTISGEKADWYTINLNNNLGANFSYTVNGAFISAQAGEWGIASTWVDGIPGIGEPVIIDHNVTLNQLATVSSITINNGKVFDGGSSTLTIATDGTLTNNGTFNANSGTVSFSGSGSVGGTSATTFNNLEIAGGVSIGGGNTINNRLVINSGGYLTAANDSDIPNYATNATLVFTGTFDINSLASGWGTTTNKFPNNLSIEGTSVTTLSFAREISGNVDIASGATFNSGGNLTLGSTPSSSASLLNLGTFNGNATIERYIAAWGSVTQGWHFLSAPVAGQDFQPEFVPNPPSTSEDFYLWDEPNSQWVNSKVGSGPYTFNEASFGTEFVTGKGYLVSYASNVTKNFIGVPNNTDVSNIALSYTSTSAAKGWNLLGNPFPSGLTWNVSTWKPGNTIISGTAKIVNSLDASYEDIDADEIIPAMNGFLVYTSAATTLSIPEESRTHSNNWYKQGNGLEKLVLKVIDLDGQTAQKTQLILNPESTSGYDFLYDSEFLPFLAPSLYTLVEGKQLSTNSIPGITGNMVIPVNFVKNDGMNFLLEAENVSVFGTDINLVDNKTGIITNLNQDPSYLFTAESGDDAARFELHFGLVGVTESPKADLTLAYVVGKTLYVKETGSQVQLEILDINGRVLDSETIISDGLFRKQLNFPPGVYIVRIADGKRVQANKIIIQ